MAGRFPRSRWWNEPAGGQPMPYVFILMAACLMLLAVSCVVL